MASRSTRSQAKNSQSTSANSPLPTTPLLKNRARKSFSPSQNVASRKRRASDSSNDSSMVTSQSTSTVLSQVQDSPDTEDLNTSSIGKHKTKRFLRLASDNEDSDSDYIPPAKEAESGRRNLPSTSGLRGNTTTPVRNVSQGITNMTLNTSQASTSKNTANQARNQEKWVNKCVFYILVADQKKHAIKKADIVKNVFENQHSSKEDYSAVLKKANDILKKTFGLEILEIKNTKNSYILENILDTDPEIREFVEYSPDEQQKRGLIFLLLTIIFMNENSITEDKLWKALEPLGLYSNCTIPHPVFGNVKKFITVELVKELYLEYTCINKDPLQYEFTWGERAAVEFKKEDLLEFACQMIDDNIKPEDWKLQYIDAKGKPSTSGA